MGMDGGVKPTGPVEAIATVSAAALEDACYDLARRQPHRSAKRPLYVTQGLAFTAANAAFAWAATKAPLLTFDVVHVIAFVIFSAAILIRLFAAASLEPILFRLAAPAQFPTYTILCPLYREAAVVPDLIAALSRLDYPTDALDILLLVEADDSETVSASQAAADGASHIKVINIPPCRPRTKPKALNVGLAEARGSLVAVYDAEDRPHPQQLRAAIAAFEEGGETLACVQAPLSIDNTEASWISRQFAAEYAIQFREMLPLLARLNLPLPLGGTSNHFRTETLRRAGGWDPFNVTEDANLGYRLARDGYRIDVIGPPTLEEAPVTLGAWLNQRTRWIKGHMQTWLVLMRDPIGCARQMGLRAFASVQLVFATGPLRRSRTARSRSSCSLRY